MLSGYRGVPLVAWLACVSLLAGCATEVAQVQFSYVVDPVRGLPDGMTTLTIQPAKIGATTDPKWSEMCANMLSSLVNESRIEFGPDVTLADRRDTQVTFDEADLAAAGLSTAQGGSGGRLLAAQGAILSSIDVKVETHIGRQRTISGIDIWGGSGRGWRHGGGDIETEEVETVSRNMTVQTNFKLVDTANNRVWDQTSSTHRSTDKTKASPIFGSSQTEAELTPRDQIIGTLVERGAREFVSRLMPCRIRVDADVVSSTNKNCMQGVAMLRAEEFESAAVLFETAMRENPNDHLAAYGAGIACEASGQFDQALSHYKRACAGALDATYMAARDRMKAYASRARPE